MPTYSQVFFVLLQVYIAYKSPSVDNSKTEREVSRLPGVLRRWCVSDHGRDKEYHMVSKDSWDEVLAAFQGPFEPLKGVATELRRVLFPQLGESTYNSISALPDDD